MQVASQYDQVASLFADAERAARTEKEISLEYQAKRKIDEVKKEAENARKLAVVILNGESQMRFINAIFGALK
jgi:hypothetical protein